jgi:thioesterase domain-containing protein
VDCYLELARRWPGALYAIQQPSPFDDLGAMAATYAGVVAATATGRRPIVGGFSFGAVVALEVAARLEVLGHDVTAVVQLDPPAPGPESASTSIADEALSQLLGGYLEGQDLLAAKRGLRTATQMEDYRRILARLLGDPTLVDRVVSETEIALRNGRILRDHARPAQVRAPLAVFRSGSSNGAGMTVAGTHLTMLRPPHVDGLVKAVEGWLAAAATSSPSE